MPGTLRGFMAIVLRDRSTNLILLQAHDWADVWNYMRKHLHPVRIEFGKGRRAVKPAAKLVKKIKATLTPAEIRALKNSL